MFPRHSDKIYVMSIYFATSFLIPVASKYYFMLQLGTPLKRITCQLSLS